MRKRLQLEICRNYFEIVCCVHNGQVKAKRFNQRFYSISNVKSDKKFTTQQFDKIKLLYIVIPTHMMVATSNSSQIDHYNVICCVLNEYVLTDKRFHPQTSQVECFKGKKKLYTVIVGGSVRCAKQTRICHAHVVQWSAHG